MLMTTHLTSMQQPAFMWAQEIQHWQRYTTLFWTDAHHVLVVLLLISGLYFLQLPALVLERLSVVALHQTCLRTKYDVQSAARSERDEREGGRDGGRERVRLRSMFVADRMVLPWPAMMRP